MGNVDKEIIGVVLGIFLASLSLAILAFTYVFFRKRLNTKDLATELVKAEGEINKFRKNEEQLYGELEDLQNKLQDAYTDPVTGLPSWSLFEGKITQSIQESDRYQLTMGLMFIDIDDFSVINDAMGNKAGDEILREVTKRLQTCIRQVDSMGRFAKDTFVLLLNHLGKPETAAVISQRVLQALSDPIYINNQEIYITACIGIALFPSDGNDLPTLLRNADQALHLAKKKGKQSCQFYEERLHNHSQRELILYNSLNRESVFEEFLLYFQPAFNVHDGKIEYMQVILYWRHPELGVIMAQELFEYAERQRKLNTFSEWLLRMSCRQFLAWRDAGFEPPLLALPLSIRQLENSNFIYHLSQIMQELKFDPTWLLIQIKEDFSQVSFEVLEKAFNMLNYLGVKMGLSNFGGGALALRYLKNFKINYLSLENSFIDDVCMNQRTQALVKSLLSLSGNLSAKMVVQGVESKDQLNKLKDLGVTMVQGSFLSEAILDRDVLAQFGHEVLP